LHWDFTLPKKKTYLDNSAIDFEHLHHAWVHDFDVSLHQQITKKHTRTCKRKRIAASAKEWKTFFLHELPQGAQMNVADAERKRTFTKLDAAEVVPAQSGNRTCAIFANAWCVGVLVFMAALKNPFSVLTRDFATS
jgi:hypothetical protein